MSYSKTNWVTGDTATAARMNKIEDGIETNSNWGNSIAEDFSTSKSYKVGDLVIYNYKLYECKTATTGAWAAAKWTQVPLNKYDGFVYVIRVDDATTTMGELQVKLFEVNAAGDHVIFDVSGLNAGMYLCTIYLNEGYYRISDMVTGFEGTGFYTSTNLLKTIIESGSSSSGTHYTAKWNQVTATMTRLNAAASITTTTTNFGHFGSVNASYDNPFDEIYPWSGRKLCNIDVLAYMALTEGDSITDCVTAWEDDVNFDYGDRYGVWVYTPAFFGRTYVIGNDRYFDVTDENLQNNIYYPESIKGRWLGCDVTLTLGGTAKHCNLPTIGMPMANVTLANQHTYAKNYGATLTDIYTVDASLLLYIVEYANMNMQTAIGQGVSDIYAQSLRLAANVTASNEIALTAANAKAVVGAIIDIGSSDGGNDIARTYVTAVNGATLTLADSVAATTSHYVSIHGRINVADEGIGSASGYLGTNGSCDAYYRGEVLYANKWRYVLGAYRQTGTSKIWIAERGDCDNYDALDTTKHTDTGIVLPAGAEGWINTLGFADGLSALGFVTSFGGSNAAPVGDYGYVPAASTGNTILLLGAGAADGLLCGGWSGFWGRASGNSYWRNGSAPALKNP